MPLPPGVRIRRAISADQRTIRAMVRSAGLDPFDLRWRNFVIAELDGEIVGIGQVRTAPRCHELGSLFVREDLRGQGIAALLIETLLAGETGDVYLECRAEMYPYYARFGFERIPWHRAPMPLKAKAGLMIPLAALSGVKGGVMRRPAPQSDAMPSPL